MSASHFNPPKKIRGKIIGAAIAAHNEKEYLQMCLNSGKNQWSFAVVADNGSTDGTSQMLSTHFPDVIRVQGHKDLWWSGGTNLAIKKCLEIGCDYVLLVNADLVLGSSCIEKLLEYENNSYNILAPVVLNICDNTIYWAGGDFGPSFKSLPLRYIYKPFFKSGSNKNALCTSPYFSSYAHGRGVLYPSKIFTEIGLYDEKRFPHYGADTAFALNAKKHGYFCKVIPTSYVYLHVNRTLLNFNENIHIRQRLIHLYNFFTPNNLSGVKVLWRFACDHVPLHARISTFIISCLRTTLRILLKNT